jgi:hypothetical protein
MGPKTGLDDKQKRKMSFRRQEFILRSAASQSIHRLIYPSLIFSVRNIFEVALSRDSDVHRYILIRKLLDPIFYTQ